MAYHTLTTIQKIKTTKKPKYIYNKLQIKEKKNDLIFPNREEGMIKVPNRNLTLSRSAFLCRAIQTFNQLPIELRKIEEPNIFKAKAKKWVKDFIEIKPP